MRWISFKKNNLCINCKIQNFQKNKFGQNLFPSPAVYKNTSSIAKCTLFNINTTCISIFFNNNNILVSSRRNKKKCFTTPEYDTLKNLRHFDSNLNRGEKSSYEFVCKIYKAINCDYHDEY